MADERVNNPCSDRYCDERESPFQPVHENEFAEGGGEDGGDFVLIPLAFVLIGLFRSL